jgi:hypothetical protein
MDWYDALKAWQDRKLSTDDAVRIAEVADVWELWELALGCGIDIKTGDRNHIAAVVRGKRQIDRGEHADMIDVIFEMDLIINDITEDDLKRRLRLKWIPTPDGFDFDHLDDYERFLALSNKDQQAFMSTLSDEDYELYQSLSISRVMYRGDGS